MTRAALTPSVSADAASAMPPPWRRLLPVGEVAAQLLQGQVHQRHGGGSLWWRRGELRIGFRRVEAFTTAEQQVEFADAYGVMPSRTSALATYEKQHPQDKAFVDGSAYAQGPVTLPGFTKVLEQFDTDLAGLAKADPKKILGDLQTNGEQVLKSDG
ncbi:hypothetical protein ACIBBB_03360 [Streptomyces sp. NPDC051217]|uniref:hypothetical protein n=1 Tax=Streptomyces sp. NPDC051217 TaxID=3365644 RepID=UPI0037894650